ncbi:MAG: hypothetical protein ACRDRJ_05790 [Streptosporangiaceae bacterium]
MLDHLQVLPEARPGGEAVVPGDHELRAGRRDWLRALGVMLGDEIQGSGHARAREVTHVLGLLAELFQAGVVGQSYGWHGPTPFHRLRSASSGRKEAE